MTRQAMSRERRDVLDRPPGEFRRCVEIAGQRGVPFPCAACLGYNSGTIVEPWRFVAGPVWEAGMADRYRHTQYGWLTLLILLGTGLLVAPLTVTLWREGTAWAALLVFVLYAVVVASFYALHVEVGTGVVRLWFGWGAIAKAYALDEIASTREVQNPWYYLWGVKSIPGGWLYAIAPGSAVEIVFHDGRLIRVGTDEPERLKAALDRGAVAAT